ncbi:MAG: hypothetical protein OXI79_06530 [Gammaproteobacteria bacterium]|nr:hypothetical protein [Gammaproteobacteria bacterium]
MDSEEFVKTSTYSAGSMIAGIAVGDVDGDAEIEIFLLADSEVHRLDTGLRLQGKFDVHRDATTILLEKSSGRRKNLVISADAQIVVLDPKSGAEVWRSLDLIGDVSVSGVQFVEVNGSVRMVSARNLECTSPGSRVVASWSLLEQPIEDDCPRTFQKMAVRASSRREVPP